MPQVGPSARLSGLGCGPWIPDPASATLPRVGGGSALVYVKGSRAAKPECFFFEAYPFKSDFHFLIYFKRLWDLCL